MPIPIIRLTRAIIIKLATWLVAVDKVDAVEIWYEREGKRHSLTI